MKGDLLRKLRDEQGLTQKELGDKLGLSDSTIRMIEIGQREGTKKNVKKIADYFNVTVDYLEGRELQQETDLLKDFLNILVDKGYITDINNIDASTQALIMNNVKQEIDRIMKQKKLR